MLVLFQALQMVGHPSDAICPNKKSGEILRTAIYDFAGDQTYRETEQYDAPVILDRRAPESLCLNGVSLVSVAQSNCRHLSRGTITSCCRRSSGTTLQLICCRCAECGAARGTFVEVPVGSRLCG